VLLEITTVYFEIALERHHLTQQRLPVHATLADKSAHQSGHCTDRRREPFMIPLAS
jgi:hypothetical protein